MAISDHRALFDRAKGLLIVLVVLGHAIEVVGGTKSLHLLYEGIFLFHMPAFLLLSGALLTRRPPRDELRIVLRRLGPAYLLGLALALAVSLAPLATADFRLLPPPWTLWFLLSLATLRLVASLTTAPQFAALAVLAAALAALVALPDELSLHRSAALAPFFAVGLLLGAQRLERRLHALGPLGTIGLLGGGLALGALLINGLGLPQGALYWRDPLADGAFGLVGSLVLSAALMTAALAASIGALGVIAQIGRAQPLEQLGAASLVIYLGHAPILALAKPLLREGRPEWLPLGGALLLLTLVGVLLPLLLQTGLRAPFAKVATWGLLRSRTSTMIGR